MKRGGEEKETEGRESWEGKEGGRDSEEGMEIQNEEGAGGCGLEVWEGGEGDG